LLLLLLEFLLFVSRWRLSQRYEHLGSVQQLKIVIVNTEFQISELTKEIR